MSKSKRKNPQASRESQDVAPKGVEENVSTNEAGTPYKSKLHAVELALEELGWDAMPARIHNHLLERYNLDMSPAHIGVNKTTILRRHGRLPAADGSRRVVSRKSAAKSPRGPRAAQPAKPSGGASFTAEDIRTVKNLLGSHDQKAVLEVAKVVAQVGVDKFRELVEVVG